MKGTRKFALTVSSPFPTFWQADNSTKLMSHYKTGNACVAKFDWMDCSVTQKAVGKGEGATLKSYLISGDARSVLHERSALNYSSVHI